METRPPPVEKKADYLGTPAPFIGFSPQVDWERSKLEGEPDDFFIVHNVNVGENPARGQVRLGSVRIPAHGIHSVEWNFVITRMRGWDTVGGHGQLRFVFKADALPVVVDPQGNPLMGERKQLRYAPESLPRWMHDIVHGKRDINRSIARIADSVTWLIKNTQVIPANAYRILEEAGLLEKNGDGPVRYYYRADLNTPYGTLYENIAH